VFEAHHLVPLALLVKGRKAKLGDVALLCANCHRLIHLVIAREKRRLSLEDAHAPCQSQHGQDAAHHSPALAHGLCLYLAF
jgi:5-methylcytosine-specific restriction protein A